MGNTAGQNVEIILSEDLESSSRKLADFLAKEAAKAVAARGSFSVALSGGSTPRTLFEMLAEEPYKSGIPWNKVEVFWGDERCVPPDSDESNYKMAHDLLLSRVAIPPARIHRMKGEIDPGKAATEYEEELRRFFGASSRFPRFDFILLGLGPDGHTASLFPGTPALVEQTRWAVSNYVEKLRTHRLTFTFPVLNAASVVAFLVSGNDKSGVLASILSGKSDYPAQRIRPSEGSLFWFLDSEAAASLKP